MKRPLEVMSMLSEQSQKIASAFEKCVRVGDKSLIQSFSIEEIERAVAEYAADKGFPHYIAMEQRIEQLKEIEDRRLQELTDSKHRKRNFRERVADHLVGFASGILLLLISQWVAC